MAKYSPSGSEIQSRPAMTGEDGLAARGIRGISSRRVVRPDGVSPGTVLIAGERIEAVVPERVALPDVIDVGDLVVSPGLVDATSTSTSRAAPSGKASTRRRARPRPAASPRIVDMPLNASR